jgi:hypothetical protein
MTRLYYSIAHWKQNSSQKIIGQNVRNKHNFPTEAYFSHHVYQKTRMSPGSLAAVHFLED